MAVGATFQDSGGSDFLGQGVSMMERSQRMRQSAENQEMRRQEFDLEQQKFAAFLPAIIAKRNADIVSAEASVANAARMEQFRGKAAANSVDYNERFQNILTIPDAQDRADTLAAFQSEVAWMEVLPEYKGFVDTVNNSRASTVTLALTNMKLDEALERARLSSEGGVARAEIQAGARTANAATRAASNEKIAAINSDTKLTLAEKQGQIAAARQADSIATLQSRAAEADQQAADAQAVGDAHSATAHRQAAASYRDAVSKATTNVGYAPSAPRDASQDPRPTPKSDAPATPLDLGVITIGGTPTAAPAAAPAPVQQAVQKPVRGTRARQNGKWYQFDGTTWKAE